MALQNHSKALNYQLIVERKSTVVKILHFPRFLLISTHTNQNNLIKQECVHLARSIFNGYMHTVNPKIFVSKNFRVKNFRIKNFRIRASVRKLKERHYVQKWHRVKGQQIGPP